MPSIDRSSSVPYYQQVYSQIARGIENGSYPVGRKLPSIRECARELGVSNTTIELAYQQLTAEGYVQARRGSGFTICAQVAKPGDVGASPSSDYARAQEALAKREAERTNRKAAAFDFAYDAVDTSLFPFAIWARTCRDVFFSKGMESACLYNDCQGLDALRVEIARYLASEYGMDCAAEQVLVMPRTRDLVSEVASLFDSAVDVIAMENPGYDEVRTRLAERGYPVRDIPAHPCPSLEDTYRLLEGAKVYFTTPACQFPTNVPMPLEIRAGLVEWARQADAYVIDDEYSWEFQSGITRMPPLATFGGAERVITMGTFSNSFTPAVCLSYAVLPPKLMMKWQDMRHDSHPQVPWQTQAAMAAFIREGHWRSHVRKVRTSAKRKRELVVDAIARHMGDAVSVVEGTSSLFVLVQARDGRGEAELVEAAARADVKVYPTSRYWRGPAPATWRYVLVGFAGIPADDIEPGVRALAEAWGMLRNT